MSERAARLMIAAATLCFSCGLSGCDRSSAVQATPCDLLPESIEGLGSHLFDASGCVALDYPGQLPFRIVVKLFDGTSIRTISQMEVPPPGEEKGRVGITLRSVSEVSADMEYRMVVSHPGGGSIKLYIPKPSDPTVLVEPLELSGQTELPSGQCTAVWGYAGSGHVGDGHGDSLPLTGSIEQRAAKAAWAVLVCVEPTP